MSGDVVVVRVRDDEVFQPLASVAVAVDLALEGDTDIPIQRFSPDRFAA